MSSLLHNFSKHKGQNIRFAKRIWECFPNDKLASVIYSCSSDLSLYGDKVVAANFCRNRFCPTCQWRRSRKLYNQNKLTLDLLREWDNYRYIFLTVTVVNEPLWNLSNRLKEMSYAWHCLVNRSFWKSQPIVGYVRTLEITYNAEANTFHPHYHCILVVKKGGWLSHRDDWLDEWVNCVNDTDICQLDIREVKKSDFKKLKKGINDSDDSKFSALDEISKYMFKSADWLDGFDFYEFYTLYSSLSGLRFFSSGGVWKDARKELNLKDVEQLSLDDNLGDYSVADCIDYHWDFILGQYLRTGLRFER